MRERERRTYTQREAHSHPLTHTQKTTTRTQEKGYYPELDDDYFQYNTAYTHIIPHTITRRDTDRDKQTHTGMMAAIAMTRRGSTSRIRHIHTTHTTHTHTTHNTNTERVRG